MSTPVATRAIVGILGGTIGLTAITAASIAAVQSMTVFESSLMSGSVPAAEITTIDVDSEEIDVRIVPTDGTEISWVASVTRYPDAASFNNAIEVDGSTLSVDLRQDRGWFPSFRLLPGVNSDRDYIEISVPTDLLPDLDLSTGVSDTNVDGSFSAVEISNGVGDLVLSGTAVSLYLENGVGDVESTMGIDNGSVVITSGVGTVDMDLGTDLAPGSVSITGGVGDVSVFLPTLTLGYDLTSQMGLGGFDNNVPEADIDVGLPVDRPVPLTVTGGIGSISLGPSEG